MSAYRAVDDGDNYNYYVQPVQGCPLYFVACGGLFSNSSPVIAPPPQSEGEAMTINSILGLAVQGLGLLIGGNDGPGEQGAEAALFKLEQAFYSSSAWRGYQVP